MSNDSDGALEEVKERTPFLAKLGLYAVGRWLKGLSEGERMDLAIKILAYALKLDFWDGYRGYIAGVGSLLSGVSLILLAAGNNEHGSVELGVGAILFGIKSLSDAAKADKQIQATKAAAVLNVAMSNPGAGPTPSAPSLVDGVTKGAIAHALSVVRSPTMSPVPLPTSEPSGEQP